MSSSNNSISGIKTYKINSFGELKIDISMLYFLEDEISNRVSDYPGFHAYTLEMGKKKIF